VPKAKGLPAQKPSNADVRRRISLADIGHIMQTQRKFRRRELLDLLRDRLQTAARENRG